MKRHFGSSPNSQADEDLARREKSSGAAGARCASAGRNAWNDGILFLAGDGSPAFPLVEVSGMRSAYIMLMDSWRHILATGTRWKGSAPMNKDTLQSHLKTFIDVFSGILCIGEWITASVISRLWINNTMSRGSPAPASPHLLQLLRAVRHGFDETWGKSSNPKSVQKKWFLTRVETWY